MGDIDKRRKFGEFYENTFGLACREVLCIAGGFWGPRGKFCWEWIDVCNIIWSTEV